jgi:hypothetical protein
MDIKGFREPQSPWFFTQPPEYLVETRVNNIEAPAKKALPAADNRYPGWAAVMDDARLSTDYRPNCAKNIPTGQQFVTRGWMQRNADALISLSRNRQAEAAGAGRSYDSRIEAAPASFIKCDPNGCQYSAASQDGIGIERKEYVPPLFGTFARSQPHSSVRDDPMLTEVYEGGRNTVRGKF